MNGTSRGGPWKIARGCCFPPGSRDMAPAKAMLERQEMPLGKWGRNEECLVTDGAPHEVTPTVLFLMAYKGFLYQRE